MLKAPWMILNRLGTVALVIYLTWLAWDYFGPRKPEISPLRQQVASELIPKIVADLRESRGDIRSVALLHLANDSSDYVTDQLRTAIEQSGILSLRDRTLAEKIRHALRLQHPSCANLDEASEAADALGVEGVLFGEVHVFESHSGEATIDVQITLADLAAALELVNRRFTNKVHEGMFSSAHLQEQVTRIGWIHRLLGWAVLVLLLPVFTINFVLTIVRKQSNRSNAFALGVYTAADALLAYLLVGANLSSWPSVLVFLVAVTGAFFYNASVMTFALKQERT